MNLGCVLGVAVNSGVGTASFASSTAPTSKQLLEVSRRRESSPSWTRKADLILEPEVQQIGWSDFSRVDEAHAAGAKAMRCALPYLRELLALRSELLPAAGILDQFENRMAS